MQDEATVSDLMTARPATVAPGDDLARVQELMTDRAIRHVPVVDAEGELQGLISHRDLVGKALFAFDELPFSEQRRALREVTAREVMTIDPDTVEADTPLTEAARLLLENKYGCLPVVSGTHLVGILTEADFVKLALVSEH